MARVCGRSRAATGRPAAPPADQRRDCGEASRNQTTTAQAGATDAEHAAAARHFGASRSRPSPTIAKRRRTGGGLGEPCRDQSGAAGHARNPSRSPKTHDRSFPGHHWRVEHRRARRYGLRPRPNQSVGIRRIWPVRARPSAAGSGKREGRYAWPTQSCPVIRRSERSGERAL